MDDCNKIKEWVQIENLPCQLRKPYSLLFLLPTCAGYCRFSPWQPRWIVLVGERAWSKSHPSLRASQWARRRWAALFPPTGHFCGFYRWAGPLVSAHTTAWSSFWESRGSRWIRDERLVLQHDLVSGTCKRRYWGTLNQQFYIILAGKPQW